MQQVIDLCSDDEIRPNPSTKQEDICESIGRPVKSEQTKEELAKEEPSLADGIHRHHPLIHGKGKSKKKRKREEKKRRYPSHRERDFSDDVQLQQFRDMITSAKKEVQIRHEELTRATNHLKNLEEQLAERLIWLRREADANFNWLGQFPWDQQLKRQLNEVFHISSFRPFQHEALNATLLKRDVFAILPTGAGKSLIYQLAAVVDGGLTLVVTPLLSLSMDQRIALRNLDIRGESIDSTTDKEVVKKIYAELLPNRGKITNSRNPRKRRMRGMQWIRDDMSPAILFVTPEQIARSKRLMSRLEAMHEMGHLSRICIDEAHCASVWGHDFRSDYRKLGLLRRQLPDAPIVCLSATSSQETTQDVCKLLETRDCIVFRGSIDRPNLFYEIREKAADDAAVLDDLLRWIRGEFAGMCGIIYVLAKKDAVNYAQSLREGGVRAGCYHGDLERWERNKVHASWSDGRIQIVVATIAFGLGIDNPRVRFVIHATMATSLEGYYQESGRAGRDGKPAKCVLLHRAKEFPKMSGFVADKGGERLQKMYEMYRYASSRGLETLCRRAAIARAFGETPPERKDKLACCDVCAARVKGSYGWVVVDVTDLARSVGRMVMRCASTRPDEKVTLLGVAADWANTGAKGKKMRGEEKAIARQICVGTRLGILVELVLMGALKEYHRHSSYAVNAYVTSDKRAQQVLDEEKIKIVVTMEKAMSLVNEGCRIVSGIGERKGVENGILEEEIVDQGTAGDTDVGDLDMNGDENGFDGGDINGRAVENGEHEQDDQGENADGEEIDVDFVENEEIAGEMDDHSVRIDDERDGSDEEIILRKRIRV